jgi:hypothetical protein
MRNLAGRTALQTECDYLVFIDDDMLLHNETLEKLIEADKDIIMAHTYIRGTPFRPMSFKLKGEAPDQKLENFDEIDEIDQEIVDCDAVGFAAVCIKTHLLRDLPPPWFVTIPEQMTEDVYFCLSCRAKLPYPVSIAVHKGVPTAHKLAPEFVHAENVKRLREITPIQDEENSRRDRSRIYYNAVMEA